MASRLGINPDPRVGGTASGVTYIAFSGATGKVTRNEDNAEATSLGQSRARQLIADN